MGLHQKTRQNKNIPPAQFRSPRYSQATKISMEQHCSGLGMVLLILKTAIERAVILGLERPITG